MIKINLIAQRKKRKLPTVLGVDLNNLNFKLIALAYILGMLGESYVVGMIDSEKEAINSELDKLKQTNQKVMAEVKEYDNVREELERFNRQVERLRERSKQVTAIINEKTNPKPVLEQIARVLPEDVWLEQLQITGSQKIIMSGGSESYVSIGNFIMSANQTTYFDNLNLVNTETEEVGSGGQSQRIETFSIEGDIQEGGSWVQ